MYAEACSTFDSKLVFWENVYHASEMHELSLSLSMFEISLNGALHDFQVGLLIIVPQHAIALWLLYRIQTLFGIIAWKPQCMMCAPLNLDSSAHNCICPESPWSKSAGLQCRSACIWGSSLDPTTGPKHKEGQKRWAKSELLLLSSPKSNRAPFTFVFSQVKKSTSLSMDRLLLTQALKQSSWWLKVGSPI